MDEQSDRITENSQDCYVLSVCTYVCIEQTSAPSIPVHGTTTLQRVHSLFRSDYIILVDVINVIMYLG